VALLLTQAQIAESAGEKPLILLDDLSSELDSEHFDNALNRALESGAQVWLTGTEPAKSSSPHKVFHVEQGGVEEVV
jgi:DNA replication and repair protein RecF